MDTLFDIKGFEGRYSITMSGKVWSHSRNKWMLFNDSGRGYKCVDFYHKESKRNRKRFYVHRLVAERFIKNEKNYKCVNHKNHIKDDNKVSNLEWCTTRQNSSYRFKSDLKKATSIYKGVNLFKNGRWRSYIRCNYKYIHIGFFNTEVEAALAYNKKAKELFGEFAVLNIISLYNLM